MRPDDIRLAINNGALNKPMLLCLGVQASATGARIRPFSYWNSRCKLLLQRFDTVKHVKERVLFPFWLLEDNLWDTSGADRCAPRGSHPKVRKYGDSLAHADGGISEDLAATVIAEGPGTVIEAVRAKYMPYIPAAALNAALVELVTGTAPVTEPDSPASTPSLHWLMQAKALLLASAVQPACVAWVNPADASRAYGPSPDDRLGRIATTDLRPWVADMSHGTAARIDAMWLDATSKMPQAMFEVENTTAIYSGILRMADFVTAASGRLDVPGFLVVPDERVADAHDQLARPTFAMSSVSAPDWCHVLPYSHLEDLLEAVTPNTFNVTVETSQVRLRSR